MKESEAIALAKCIIDDFRFSESQTLNIDSASNKYLRNPKLRFHLRINAITYKLQYLSYGSSEYPKVILSKSDVPIQNPYVSRSLTRHSEVMLQGDTGNSSASVSSTENNAIAKNISESVTLRSDLSSSSSNIQNEKNILPIGDEAMIQVGRKRSADEDALTPPAKRRMKRPGGCAPGEYKGDEEYNKLPTTEAKFHCGDKVSVNAALGEIIEHIPKFRAHYYMIQYENGEIRESIEDSITTFHFSTTKAYNLRRIYNSINHKNI